MRTLRFLLFSLWLQKPWRLLLDMLWDAGMSFSGAGARLAALKAKGLSLSGFRCSRDVFVSSGAIVSLPTQGRIHIGPETFVGRQAYFDNHARIEIGEGCLIGGFVRFLTATHDVETFELACRPVRVGPFCWIGANVTILPGVTIGKGCIIGAGSVVTRDIPDWSIAYGVPCQPRRERPRPIRQRTATGREVMLHD